MKILSAQQTRMADAYTIEHEPILSVDLMERAATLCYDWFVKRYRTSVNISIFCGVGNNGGDGLVIARLLKKKGYTVKVFVVEFSNDYSPDFSINLNRLKEDDIIPEFLTNDCYSFKLKEDCIVIDAIFGSGLSRPIDGFIANVISDLNRCEKEIISIDIPSGVFSDDNSNNPLQHAIKAKYTLTFQHPKLVMMFPQYAKYVGEWHAFDIGLHQLFLHEIASNNMLITKNIIKTIIHKRGKFTHKGNFGHALLIAGSKGKIGAAVLASRSCLRSGVGLLTVQVPLIGLDVLQKTVPEAMCIPDFEQDIISELPDISKYNSIGVGPGIDKALKTEKVLEQLLKEFKKPIVLDADALNILSDNKNWLSLLPSNSILTPHPKEFERLVGSWVNDEERLLKQKEFSKKYKVIVVLKGAHTSITDATENVFFNNTGNPGMATAGSGDVLTGLITGLLAQGYSPLNAAILGVYLHGLAGDLAKAIVGEKSLIASDIITYLPMAYAKLEDA